MTRTTTLLAAAGAVLAATAALPAHAQVEGRLATVDVTRTIIGTTAFQTAYEQVNTTYAEQTNLRRTKVQERQNLLVKFDKNKDNNIEGDEKTAMEKSPDYAKIQTLEQEIVGLTNQVDGARVYAVEQIIVQYSSALADVTTAEKIKLVIDPSTLLFAPPEADITAKVTTALNTRVPAVGVVPPAGWQPSREGIQLYQDIQQRLQLAAQIQQQQAAAAAQQGDPAAPVGR